MAQLGQLAARRSNRSLIKKGSDIRRLPMQVEWPTRLPRLCSSSVRAEVPQSCGSRLWCSSSHCQELSQSNGQTRTGVRDLRHAAPRRGLPALLVDASQHRQSQLIGGQVPELVHVAVTSDRRGEQASFDLADGVARIFNRWPVDGDGKGHPQIVGSESTETANDVPDSPPLSSYAGTVGQFGTFGDTPRCLVSRGRSSLTRANHADLRPPSE